MAQKYIKELSVEDLENLTAQKQSLEKRLEEEEISLETKQEVLEIMELLEAKYQMIANGKSYVIVEKGEN